MKTVVKAFMCLVALSMIGGVIYGTLYPRTEAAEKKPAAPEKPDYTPAAKLMIMASMRDPASAVFGRVFEKKAKDGKLYVCGYVNGKNGFGGYTGFKEFVISVELGYRAVNDDSAKFASYWNRICASK